MVAAPDSSQALRQRPTGATAEAHRMRTIKRAIIRAASGTEVARALKDAMMRGA